MADNNNFISNFFSRFGFGSAVGGSLNPPTNRRQRIRGYTKLEPEQTQHTGSLDYARNFSHNLFLNSATAKAVGRAFRSGVIGSGVKLRSEVRHKNKDRRTGTYKLNNAVNEKIVKDWEAWGRTATVDGELTWHKLTRKVLSTIIESGECYIRLLDIPPSNEAKGIRSHIPFSMQILESDMLDENYTGTIDENSGEYWMEGIKYDRFNKALSYAFKVIVRGFYETREYDARNTLHLYVSDELRPNARRGWPWLTNVLTVIDRLDAYLATQLLHAESNAAINTYVIPDSTQAAPLDDNTSYEELADQSNRGGGIRVLPAGSQVHERPQIASQQLDQFVTTSLRQVAAAVGITYESIALDHSRSNFSSARMGNLVNSDRFDEIRKFLIEEFFDVAYRRWLRAYLLTNPFPASPSENTDNYHHSWIAKKIPHVEPVKAVTAAEKLHKLGIVSKATIAQDLGYDLDSELKQMVIDEKASEPVIDAKLKALPMDVVVEGNTKIMKTPNDGSQSRNN